MRDCDERVRRARRAPATARPPHARHPLPRADYEDLLSSQFGHMGYIFVIGAMGIFAYGAMVAYLMGIGASVRCAVRNKRDLEGHP